MEKKYPLLLILLGFALFSFGIIVGKYQIFPYQLIKTFNDSFKSSEKLSNQKWIDTVRSFDYFNLKADVAFVGDSITYQGRWSEFFPFLKVVNRGIGSDSTSDILLRIDSILSTEPSKVFIMLGINDIHENISVPKIIDNYESIVNALLKSNIEVFIQSTIQCEKSVCGNLKVELVNELNKGLEQLASKNQANFIHLRDLSSTRGIDSKYTSDGIHLTTEGYIYWTRIIAPLLTNEI